MAEERAHAFHCCKPSGETGNTRSCWCPSKPCRTKLLRRTLFGMDGCSSDETTTRFAGDMPLSFAYAALILPDQCCGSLAITTFTRIVNGSKSDIQSTISGVKLCPQTVLGATAGVRSQQHMLAYNDSSTSCGFRRFSCTPFHVHHSNPHPVHHSNIHPALVTLPGPHLHPSHSTALQIHAQPIHEASTATRFHTGCFRPPSVLFQHCTGHW